MADISKASLRYLRCSGWLERLKTLNQAVWLGLLSSDELNEVTRSYYSASVFNSEEHNLYGLWPWEAEFVRKYLADTTDVLIAGAGGGREVIALARLGLKVTAFDFSAELVDSCRAHLKKVGVTARVLEAGPDVLPKELGAYDAILLGRGFYHHIPGRSRRIALLRECHKHIETDAPLLLSDFYTRPSPSRLYRRISLIANFVRRVRWSGEVVEAGDWLSESMQHAFVRDEIESELREGGFRLEVFAASKGGPELAHAVGRAVPKSRDFG